MDIRLTKTTVEVFFRGSRVASHLRVSRQLRDPVTPPEHMPMEHQLADYSTYGTLGFEDRLSLLMDAEWNRRQVNKLVRYIKNAHFSAPNATIEWVEYHEDRRLDKAEILRFSTCQ